MRSNINELCVAILMRYAISLRMRRRNTSELAPRRHFLVLTDRTKKDTKLTSVHLVHLRYPQTQTINHQPAQTRHQSTHPTPQFKYHRCPTPVPFLHSSHSSKFLSTNSLTKLQSLQTCLAPKPSPTSLAPSSGNSSSSVKSALHNIVCLK